MNMSSLDYHVTLLTDAELADEQEHKSLNQIAVQTYPGLTVDTALPQEWVNDMARKGVEVRGRFVWGYPYGSIGGRPHPLTVEAAVEGCIHGT